MNACLDRATRQFSLAMPEAMTMYFDAVREFGTIVAVNDTSHHGVTVQVAAPDVATATAVARQVEQRLGQQGLGPAFPRTHFGGVFVRVPVYRWEITTMTDLGDGQWALLVPPTPDLLHLLNTVAGLGAWDRTYRGEASLPVTLYPESTVDLYETKQEIEDELSAWFGDRTVLTEIA